MHGPRGLRAPQRGLLCIQEQRHSQSWRGKTLLLQWIPLNRDQFCTQKIPFNRKSPLSESRLSEIHCVLCTYSYYSKIESFQAFLVTLFRFISLPKGRSSLGEDMVTLMDLASGEQCQAISQCKMKQVEECMAIMWTKMLNLKYEIDVMLKKHESFIISTFWWQFRGISSRRFATYFVGIFSLIFRQHYSAPFCCYTE